MSNLFFLFLASLVLYFSVTCNGVERYRYPVSKSYTLYSSKMKSMPLGPQPKMYRWQGAMLDTFPMMPMAEKHKKGFKPRKLDKQISDIVYWRVSNEGSFGPYQITKSMVEETMSDVMRLQGFTIFTCTNALANLGVPTQAAESICFNAEPWATTECNALTWLDFSIADEIQAAIEKRGLGIEISDICRLVEMIKPSLFSRPTKKEIYGICQEKINGQLLKSYGIDNFDADVICTTMDYTMHPYCEDLDKDDRADVLKLGLHLGKFLYPRRMPLLVRDLCIARKGMKTQPSKELCRNQLTKHLLPKGMELGEVLLPAKWPFYTQIWMACGYVFPRQARGRVKDELDRAMSELAFGLKWNDKKFSGKYDDFTPCKLASVHGEIETELSSIDEAIEDSDNILSEDSEISPLTDFQFNENEVPARESAVRIYEETPLPDQVIHPIRETAALNGVQKIWAQILFDFYRAAGYKAHKIYDFERLTYKFDTTDIFESCVANIIDKIRRFPGSQKDGNSKPFSSKVVREWCAAIDGSRSKSCSDLRTPHFLWAKRVHSNMQKMKTLSDWAFDIRDVCAFLDYVEPWKFTNRRGLSSTCMSAMNKGEAINRSGKRRSFIKKYRLSDKDAKKMCTFLSPVYPEACRDLDGESLTISNKLALSLSRISIDEKTLPVPFEVACEVLAKVKPSGTVEHCIFAVGEHVGGIAVENGFGGIKKYGSASSFPDFNLKFMVENVCKRLFSGHEVENLGMIEKLIMEVYSDIQRNVAPTKHEYLKAKDDLSDKDSDLESSYYSEGLFPYVPSRHSIREAKFFGPASGKYWNVFGAEPGAIDMFSDQVNQMAFVSSKHFEILEQGDVVSSWAELLMQKYNAIAPQSYKRAKDSQTWVNVARLIDNDPRAIGLSCVSILITRYKMAREVAIATCEAIDPYGERACQLLPIILLDFSLEIHSKISTQGKVLVDMRDICKMMYTFDPLSVVDGQLGEVSRRCANSNIILQFQKKYGFNRDEATYICHIIDFSRYEGFKGLTIPQRKRVVRMAIMLSDAIAADHPSTSIIAVGGFFRNLPTFHWSNIINLVRNTSTDPSNECNTECDAQGPFAELDSALLKYCVDICTGSVEKLDVTRAVQWYE